MKQIELGFQGDIYEGENILLCIKDDGTITLANHGWWPRSGGMVSDSLEPDYFRTHTVEEFIQFLTQHYNTEHSWHKWDFTSLANKKEIADLFREGSQEDTWTPGGRTE